MSAATAILKLQRLAREEDGAGQAPETRFILADDWALVSDADRERIVREARRDRELLVTSAYPGDDEL